MNNIQREKLLCLRHGYFKVDINDPDCPACQLEAERDKLREELLQEIRNRKFACKCWPNLRAENSALKVSIAAAFSDGYKTAKIATTREIIEILEEYGNSIWSGCQAAELIKTKFGIEVE